MARAPIKKRKQKAAENGEDDDEEDDDEEDEKKAAKESVKEDRALHGLVVKAIKGKKIGKVSRLAKAED